MRTVRKGWLFGWRANPVHVLQETRQGFVLVRGGGGWRQIHDSERVVLLPRRVGCSDWRPSLWWTSELWRSAEWAWIYGAP